MSQKSKGCCQQELGEIRNEGDLQKEKKSFPAEFSGGKEQ
jgi:hypothetical protein